MGGRSSNRENARPRAGDGGSTPPGSTTHKLPVEADARDATSVYGEIAKVFRHAVVYGVAIASGKLVGFVMIPIYTRYLSPTDYGVLELVQLASYVLSIILAFGFTAAVLRFYYQYDSEDARSQVVSTATISTTLCALVACLLLLTQARLIARVVTGSADHHVLFSLMIGGLWCDVALVVPLAYVRVLEKSLMYGAIAVARLVVGLSLNILFVMVLRWGVLGILLSGIVVGALSTAVLMPWVFRRVGVKVAKAKLREMVRYSAPLVPASLAMFVLHFADRFFLGRMSTLEEVGLYALGYKFAMMLPALIVQPIGLIWDPARFAISRRPDAREVYAKVFTYFFLIAAIFALALSMLIRDMIRVMASPRFLPAYTVVPVILAGLVCLSTSQFFEIGIHLTKRTIYRAIAVGGAAVINVALNVLLIPVHGMMGAAVATLLSFGSLAIMSYVFGQRQYHIPYEFGRVASVLAATAIVYWASKWVQPESVYSSVGVRLGLLALFPLVLGLLGFYRLEELRRIRSLTRSGLSLIRNRLSGAEQTA